MIDMDIDASMFYGIIVGLVVAVNILYWMDKKELLQNNLKIV